MKVDTSKQENQPIRVVVMGALGRAGRTAVDILCCEPGIDVVGIVDFCVQKNTFLLPGDSHEIPASHDLESILTSCRPDVLVDFTQPSATLKAAKAAVDYGVHMVIGTTGLSDKQFRIIDDLSKKAGVGVLTGTLSLGVALASHLAAIAAQYFNNVEIIDLGKKDKLDAPSGSALDIARAMVDARGKPFELSSGTCEKQACRGQQYGGIPIHSLRLTDCYIHEKVFFGSPAGTLVTLGVELTSENYMNPGIIIAVREVGKLKGLVYGMDKLLLKAGKSMKGSI